MAECGVDSVAGTVNLAVARRVDTVQVGRRHELTSR
jgi:hypothetical protein